MDYFDVSDVEKKILMTRVLYISMNGMTEALGESQVVQYLTELAKNNTIYLLSFEKNNNPEKLERIKKTICDSGIHWKHFGYSNHYGIFSSLSQIIKSFFIMSAWIKKENIQVVHARSLIPAFIGVLLKKTSRIQLLFDIRGFAIDEKILEGRLRNNGLLTYTLKKLEAYVYKSADHIVTLTHASKPIIETLYQINQTKITVIPTCANTQLFKALPAHEKHLLRKEAGFNEQDIIILRNGSFNKSYDFLAEISLFEQIAALEPRSIFLFLNHDQHDLIRGHLEKSSIPSSKYHVLAVDFHKVSEYLNIADLCVFFVKPSFAKQASAPTKFAEIIACQLYSITNKHYGDMEYYFSSYRVGQLLDLKEVRTNPEAAAIMTLNFINASRYKQENKSDFLALYKHHFSKDVAIGRYQKIYGELTQLITGHQNNMGI